MIVGEGDGQQHSRFDALFPNYRLHRATTQAENCHFRLVYDGCEMRAANAALIQDRKSTRLNSSHSQISYAVFCLKKKTDNITNHAFKMDDSFRPWIYC